MKTKYKMTLATGWITPDGKYFSCMPWEHDKVVLDILENEYSFKNPTVETAETFGFIRVTGRVNAPFLFAQGYNEFKFEELNQAQIDTIFDYQQKFNIKKFKL